MEFLRYQGEELLPPLTHQFLFFFFVIFISCFFRLSLLLHSVVLISSFFSFFLVHYFHYCIISFRIGKRDGWVGLNLSAGEEGVFGCRFACCIGFPKSCFSFLHVFDRMKAFSPYSAYLSRFL